MLHKNCRTFTHHEPRLSLLSQFTSCLFCIEYLQIDPKHFDDRGYNGLFLNYLIIAQQTDIHMLISFVLLEEALMVVAASIVRLTTFIRINELSHSTILCLNIRLGNVRKPNLI